MSALVAAVCAGGVGPAVADTPTHLKPGARPVERPLAGAESHHYTLKLKAGEYCTIRVRQSAIDVVVVVDGPDGTRIAEVDTPRRTTGDELVEIVATTSGRHAVTVRAREDDAPKAAYAIGVDRPRRATADDRRRVAALRLFERYRTIQDRVVTLGRERSDLTALRKRTPDEDARLATVEADLRVAAQAYQTFLATLAADFGVADAGERVFQLREAQSLMSDLRDLGSGTVALYTVVGEQRYRVILITPDVQKAAEYAIGAADLRRKILAFREALQNPDTDPRPLAKDLYTILVGPIARDLQQAGARTLMWALDDVLRYIPFGALHDGRAYLVERYRNVVFTPASRGSLRERPVAWQAGLGVGVSKAQEGFQSLPAVADELRGIIRDDRVAQSTGVLRGRLLLDEAFTESALRAELRQRPPVVHVASHFQFHPGNEADSFLLLGDGRHLSVADLKTEWNLFDGVDLLTLSACDTATGAGGATGKEVESFGVLAQRNGARTVIATLWPVADRSTRQLMEYFYRARTADGTVSKGEALRRAQLALLRGASLDSDRALRGLKLAAQVLPAQGTARPSAYSHPYYWAPFLLIGNWR